MSNYLEEIRKKSLERLESIRNELKTDIDSYTGKACVYATGSFGRLEAGPQSDLDLFIVADADKEKSLLTNIDEIGLQYKLIQAAKKAGLPEFDRDGAFLKAHTIDDYVNSLGGPDDDVKNTFTGRLLLLLESQLVVGDEIYDKLISKVVTRYFRDFKGHESDFRPAFLINDILRMWRTFCVNYEHRRTPEKSNKGKMKNLKLKYCRMITCYSAIIYLVSVFAKNSTVTEENVREMISSTPTERLSKVAEILCQGNPDSELKNSISNSLSLYAEFIKHTHRNNDTTEFEKWHTQSYNFGAAMEKTLKIAGSIGDGPKILRLVLI